MASPLKKPNSNQEVRGIDRPLYGSQGPVTISRSRSTRDVVTSPELGLYKLDVHLRAHSCAYMTTAET